jgi:uncharacterized protein (DUF169 family)
MTNTEIQEVIRNVLHIKREFVGLKVWKQEPQEIRKYEGKAFPGMCAQIGEVLKTGETFYTDKEQHYCTGGVVAMGVLPPTSNEDAVKIAKMHIKMMQDYQDLDTALHYQEEAKKLIPSVQDKNVAVQLGLFKDLEDPDIVLIFCTPRAADMLNRAYAYKVGELIRGFGGNGGCPFLIQYPYVTRKPSFSYSDITWRKFIGLHEEELTVSFPSQSLLSFTDSLPSVAERYEKYGEGMEM